MNITESILHKIAPHAPKDVQKFVPFLNAEMDYRQINTLSRAACFLAQLAHESDSFKATEEYASGRAYEGRVSLGNTHTGDGIKYKGRGLIMTTGRFNYKEVGDALGIDLVNTPKLLSQPEWAVKSAGWYWTKHKLNAFADHINAGLPVDKEPNLTAFKALTKAINGGFNGLESRIEYYRRSVEALKEAV